MCKICTRMLDPTPRLWLLLGRKTWEREGWSFNDISNVLLLRKKTEGQKAKFLYLYWLDRCLLFYYIIFCAFLYVLNSLYWTNTSKEMLEAIKPSPPMSIGISYLVTEPLLWLFILQVHFVLILKLRIYHI